MRGMMLVRVFLDHLSLLLTSKVSSFGRINLSLRLCPIEMRVSDVLADRFSVLACPLVSDGFFG